MREINLFYFILKYISLLGINIRFTVQTKLLKKKKNLIRFIELPVFSIIYFYYFYYCCCYNYSFVMTK